MSARNIRATAHAPRLNVRSTCPLPKSWTQNRPVSRCSQTGDPGDAVDSSQWTKGRRLSVLARIFFFLRKLGITKIYTCRTLANPEGIAIYRLHAIDISRMCYRPLHSVIYDTLFNQLQPITQFCDRFPCFASRAQDRAHHTAHNIIHVSMELQCSTIIMVHRRHFSRITQKR